MYLQFGDTKPISSEDLRVVNVPFEVTQLPAKIALIDEGSYSMNDQFTVVMWDPDAPAGTFYHALFIGVNRELRGGDTVLEYLPPQKVNHHYHYEVYRQLRGLSIDNASRTDFDFDEFLRQGLVKVGEVIVYTIIQSPMNDQLKEDIRPHDFMKPGGLTKKEESYCRCVLHVKAGGRARNPYAVCTKSVGTQVRTCGDHYDYDAMPLPELLAYADLKNLEVRDRSSRESVIDAIFQWKEEH